jgi:hypothetical protein
MLGSGSKQALLVPEHDTKAYGLLFAGKQWNFKQYSCLLNVLKRVRSCTAEQPSWQRNFRRYEEGKLEGNKLVTLPANGSECLLISI